MTLAFGQPVTLIRRSVTGQDTFGNDVMSETATVVVGAFTPGGSTEVLQGQDTVIDQPTVYLPAGTVVAAIDAVEVAGNRYEVDGRPNNWVNPFTGAQPGVEVRLRRVTG